MVFPDAPLGEVVTLKRGYDLPAVSRRPGDVPVVSSKGVIDRHERARVEGPGVVIGRTGTLGRVIFLEEAFWPLNTTLYVRDFLGNDPRFVSYLLESLDYESLNDKAAIPGVSRQMLHRQRVPCPPLRDQRRIAATLGLLDSKLDLLRRQECVLAELGASLHGRIPRGRTRALAELCETIGNGATPLRSRPAYWKRGSLPWYRSGELGDAPLVHAAESITREGLDHSACREWPAGTVLIAIYAAPTLGRMGLLTHPAAVNQACCALVPHAGIGSAFLFHALLATRDSLERLANGAAQQNLRQDLVREHLLPVPPLRAIRAFHRSATTLLAQRAHLLRERDAVRALRRALLHRLLRDS